MKRKKDRERERKEKKKEEERVLGTYRRARINPNLSSFSKSAGHLNVGAVVVVGGDVEAVVVALIEGDSCSGGCVCKGIGGTVVNWDGFDMARFPLF